MGQDCCPAQSLIGSPGTLGEPLHKLEIRAQGGTKTILTGFVTKRKKGLETILTFRTYIQGTCTRTRPHYFLNRAYKKLRGDSELNLNGNREIASG